MWRVKADGGSGVTNGALDPTFDTDGVAVIDGGGSAFAQRLGTAARRQDPSRGGCAGRRQPEHRDAVAPAADGGAGAVNGALDPTFGTGGADDGQRGVRRRTPTRSRCSPTAGSSWPGANFNVFNGSLLVFRALGDPFAVNVTKAGTGSGSVQSSPPGIDCGGVVLGTIRRRLRGRH